MPALRRFEVHGHRGARAHRPENTLEGFRYALSCGVDAIEVDVALTQDEVPVLLHDRALNTQLYRWQGPQGPLDILDSEVLKALGLSSEAFEIFIKDLKAAELMKLDVGSIAHPEFPQQRTREGLSPPTLEDFVKLMMSSPGSPKLNIEIKTHPILVDETLDPEDFAVAILEVLKAHKVPYERVLFQSFDPRSLLAVKSRDSAWRASFLVDAWTDDLTEVASDLGLEGLSPRWDLLNADRVKAARKSGLEVYVWTPNSESEWKRLAELGVDGIITDDPAACLAFRSQLLSAHE